MSNRRGYNLVPLRRDRDEDIRELVDSRYNSRVRLNEHLLSSVGSAANVVRSSVTGGLPPIVKQSADWRLRTDASAAAIIPTDAQRERFVNLVGVRASMLQPFRWPTPADADMDLAYVRYARELDYISWLARLDVRGILEEDGSGVNLRFLGLEIPLINSSRSSTL